MGSIEKQIAEHWRTSKPKPGRRFIFGPRPYRGHRKGMTKRNYFQEIGAGDSRFDTATYEECIIMNKP